MEVDWDADISCICSHQVTSVFVPRLLARASREISCLSCTRRLRMVKSELSSRRYLLLSLLFHFLSSSMLLCVRIAKKKGCLHHCRIERGGC
jgi:hypothetical protein